MQYKAKKKKKSKTTIAFLLFCTVVPIIHVILFYFATNISAFPMAFRNSQGEWTFDNFVRFWNEITSEGTQLSDALKNTMITFGICFLRYPFQVLVSYFIYKKVPFSGFYRILFFLPSLIFSVATSLMFTYITAPEGFIAQWAGKIAGVDYVPELLADSQFANMTIWGRMLWMGFPGDLIIWGGAFARIPEDVLESARLDGVNWIQEFTKIIVPLVWPTVALQMVLMFCGIFNADGGVYLLTKGEYGTHTIKSWMYTQLVNSSGGNYTSNAYNYLSAVGLVVSVIALVISFSIRKWTDKAFEDVEY